MSSWLGELGTHWAHLCGRKQQVGPNHLSVTCCRVPRAPPAHVQLVPQDHVALTRQQRFDQALMQAAHGVACRLIIAFQGRQEQHNEPLSEDSLVAVYTLGHHFANSLRYPCRIALTC